MSKSQRLLLADVRRVISLVEELSDVGVEPHAWRLAALKGLQTLVNGQVAFTLDMKNAFPRTAPTLIQPIDIGWETDSARRRFLQYYETGEAAEDPGSVALFASHLTTRFITRSRREMVNDAEWYGSSTVSEARRSGNVDDYLHSSVRLRPGVIQGFILYRTWSDTPFQDRQRRIMRLFHGHLLRRIAEGMRQTNMFHGPPMLSPRLKQTLELLLAGKSMKEIADTLSLSHHTINDYLKAIYKRFGVHTRAELIALHHQQAQKKVLLLPPELLPQNGH